jgi:glycosyltransferase involved in cell wall biosynthesis
MAKIVTVAVPIYKRLQFLPSVLEIVASQDCPDVELLISDNGMNGDTVPQIVTQYYKKPFTFRQNASTVNMSTHFTQLIESAAGEYFVVLADDDEISPNYVSDLMALLERNPQASVAFSTQESIDQTGKVFGRSKQTVPELLSGPEFIRAAWGTREYGFGSFSTYMARTEKLLAAGGYPNFWVAQGDEDALIVKMCLDNFVAFSTRSVFRKRYDESTDQQSLPIRDLARGLRDFLRFFDTDEKILEYASSQPAEWSRSKRYLVDAAWRTYYLRWANTYRNRLPTIQWVLAAFALPPIPAYYKAVASTLTAACMAGTLTQVNRFFPQAYTAYRSVKTRFRKPA